MSSTYSKPFLFDQISKESYQQLFHCLQASTRHFSSGDTIFQFGESYQSVGIIVSGSAVIIRYETNGTRTILEHLRQHELFGEILAFPSPEFESIEIICSSDCEVIFFDYLHMIRPCPKICPQHCQLIQNLLAIVSAKVLHFSQRIELLSKRSIRDKLICYFYQLTAKTGAAQATIPFTMSDLADYLCIDRSAMTRELKKLKEEHWIKLDKYTVTLLKQDDQELELPDSFT